MRAVWCEGFVSFVVREVVVCVWGDKLGEA
jgi:hypothetical protein